MSYHFIGIGGIGMSSLAKILLEQKKKVKGSDIKSSDLITELKKGGAKVFPSHKKENISDEDIIIYNSDIPENNVELSHAKEKKLKVMHRSELLKTLISPYFSLLVAGTHGKTTTTSLLSQVLCDASLDPSYSIGGILKSAGSNAHLGKGRYFVAEADESDGSFLNYFGDGGIVLNIEKEHLKYWKSLDNLKMGFYKFIQNIKNPDFLVWCKEDPILQEMNFKSESFGLSDDADIYASNISQEGFRMVFDINYKNKIYKKVSLNLVGRHNVLNALSVFLLAKKIGVEEEIIFHSFAKFSGVKRRMDKIAEVGRVLFLEDYGHHPTEIKVTLSALRLAVKERRMITVFQPHRYSRTKCLLDEFANSFDSSDEIIITDIYSANEPEEEKISEKLLVEKIRERNKRCRYVEKKELKKEMINLSRPFDVVIFLGAGDISSIGKNIAMEYTKKSKKLKLALLFGGKSVEHEISKLSAKSISKNLDFSVYDIDSFYVDLEGKWHEADKNLNPIFSKEKNFSTQIIKKILKADICFPIFHGTNGEDGMIQGFLDTLNVAYTGCSYPACSCSMNKAWVKYIAKENGIMTADFIEITKNLYEMEKKRYLDEILQKFSLPFFIKPSHLGSSVGVKKISSFKDVEEEIEKVFQLDDSLIVEKAIIGQEIEVAVLGNTFVEAAIPGEILTGGLFYDFEKKYGKNGFQTCVPANISVDALEMFKECAIKIYKLVGCQGFARIDFFYQEGMIYLNEINPIPGFTEISLYPKMWEKSFISFKDLLDRIVILGLHKKMLKV